ncbi:MAG: transcriptional regulator NrdR [Ilumatobacter sp.]|nr:transcriptional regulator NrdR [Ilumatobacter sp.]
MKCPVCRYDETKVVDSRIAEENTAIRRRRQCLSCAHRFTTFERVDHAPLTVHTPAGRIPPSDRQKLVSGLSAATTRRDVAPVVLEQIAGSVEDALRLQGSEVTSANIGIVVLEELRTVDEVAYLRFASVYKDFDAAADFHRELELMQKADPASV